MAATSARSGRTPGTPRTYVRPDGTEGECSTPVPMHTGDITKGTLASIEKAMEPAFGKGWLK